MPLNFYMNESHLRSVIKGVSWRIIGTLDTMFLSFLVQYFHINASASGPKASNQDMAAKSVLIGMVEFVTKILLFYIHERIWLYFLKGRDQTKTISIIKAVSWRVVGSLDTMLWSGVILKDFQKGVTIGLLEVFTKIFLFYLHERIWHKLPIGTVRRWFNIKPKAE